MNIALIALYVLLELFEIWWQKAPTFGAILEKVYALYQKSIFFVLFAHPTLFLLAFMMVLHHDSLAIQIAFGIKLGDIALKLLLIKKLFLEKYVSDELRIFMEAKVEPWMLYFGVVLYPILLFIGIE